MKLLTRSVIAAVMLAGAAGSAAAQTPEERITLTFTPAVATVGGDTAAAMSGSLGYRFTEHVSFEGETSRGSTRRVVAFAISSGSRPATSQVGSSPIFSRVVRGGAITRGCRR
jgi:hypothetical protein